MSWGERSCHWLNHPFRPCTPTWQGCNKSCKTYKKKPSVHTMESSLSISGAGQNSFSPFLFKHRLDPIFRPYGV